MSDFYFLILLEFIVLGRIDARLDGLIPMRLHFAVLILYLNSCSYVLEYYTIN